MPAERTGEYYVVLDDETDARIQGVMVDMMHRLLKEDIRVSKITMGGLLRILLQTHPAVTGQPIDRETVPQQVLAHVLQMQKTGPKPKAQVRPKPSTRVGERLRIERKRRGWSQARLSDESGLQQSHLSAIEAGTIQAPRFDIVLKLAQALEIPVEVLAEDVHG